MMTSARIEFLSKELFEAAMTQAPSAGEARSRAHVALNRILNRDPELDRLWEIVSALRFERDARANTPARH